MAEAPLLLVHLGDDVPRYASAALTLTVRHSGSPVVLLASRAFERVVPDGCRFVAIDEFHDSGRSASLLQGLAPSVAGRSELWRTSVERFAVLHDYASAEGLVEFFHAELDVLAFELPLLALAIGATGCSGMFVPFDHPERAIASLVYVNDPAALGRFVEWLPTQRYTSDMDAVAQFARHDPTSVIGLPTLEVLQDVRRFESVGLRVLRPGAVGFLVDAASLGQWVAGIDARNRSWRRVERNHFVNEMVPDPAHLAASELTWDAPLPVLVAPDGRSYRVHCLHVHSKIHQHLLAPSALPRLLFRAQRAGQGVLPGGRRRLVHRSVSVVRRRARRTVIATLRRVGRRR